MTIQEILDYVDEVKINDFSTTNKMQWLNEIETQIQTEVLLLDKAETYVYSSIYSNTGIFFPDNKTMVLPSEHSLRTGGIVTITGLVTYAENNLTAQILEVDGKKIIFAENTFSATGETGDSAGIINFDGSDIPLKQPEQWDKLYYSYLIAQIDYYNGEFDRYANSLDVFNAHWSSFCKWYTTRKDRGAIQ